jgi:S1-C subfamily serine protease
VVGLAIVAGGLSGAIVSLAIDGADAGQGAPAIASEAGPGVPPISAILAEIKESVVRIDASAHVNLGPGGQQIAAEATGSGFVLDADGSIATVAHVVEGAEAITVTLQDGSTAPATVVGSDADADLAVIRVERGGLAPAALGSSAQLEVGDMVLAIGHALALEGEPTASLGIVSAIDRSISTNTTTYENLLQTDAAINSGDSGGPLVNAAGEVIGVNTAKVSSEVAESMGFAIAIDDALPVLEALRNG